MEIPDVVRKLMSEHPELELFISLLLEENDALHGKIEFLEKKIHELLKQNRRLERVLNELIGPDAMKWRDQDRYIRIRPIPKEERKVKRARARGANHKGVARPVPKEVDATVQVTAERCPRGHELREPIGFAERYVEEIVPARVVRKKYLITIYWDPVCKKKVRGRPLDVLPHERFGINLMLLVSYMRICGITTKKIQSLLLELYGLRLSRSTLLHMEGRIAGEFGEYYKKVREEIQASKAVDFDETSWPVSGVNHWLWAFVSKGATWYAVKHGRGRGVVEETLGKDYRGVTGSDFYPPWDELNYRSQKCLIHLLRNFRRTEAKRGKKLTLQFARFAKKVRRLVRDAVRVHDKIGDGDERLRRKKRLEERLRLIYSRRYTDKDCKRICKLLRKHRNNLFTFLEVEDVHWNTNEVERALRPSVVVRKNSYGSRSDIGARNHAVLMTVSETCKRRGMNFMDFGRSYLQERLGNGGLPKR